jgi:alkyl sulfatase BDS1-like metallo-beta-lactamase superfamily hydrolase
MGTLRDLSARLLAGESSDYHPFSSPLAIEEIAERSAFVSSFANVTAFDTDEGLVLVDTGSFLLAAPTKGIVRGFSTRPLHTAIWTHGHVDHCFGVELYDAEGSRARVVGHQALPARLDRYALTRGWNGCINSRQFRAEIEWPLNLRRPDVLYDRAIDLEIGGVRFEVRHARGETDDGSWVWVPSRKVLCTGDLFIWASPNAGNPQKVQRYARDWAVALRTMSALGAEVLCPGHGVPIFGAEAVRRALDETASLLEHLHDRTVALMNEGATLDRVLAEVKAPAALLDRPYLRPIYDEPEFVVRNVWRLYGGWWDGNPAHLKPGQDRALARELADLAGGAQVMAERALVKSTAGEHAIACHLAENAWLAAPDDDVVRQARAKVYRARAKAETSLMAKGVYEAAAEEKKKSR